MIKTITSLIFSLVLAMPVGVGAVEGQTCGGIQGTICPEGYSCKADGAYADASGICVKMGGGPIPAGRPASVRPYGELRQEAKEVRGEAREAAKEKREEVRAEIKDKREEVRADMQTKREVMRKEIEVKRVDVQMKITAQREELKTKLKKIKDENKQKAVERINDEFGNINMRRTAEFAKALDQIDVVLDRVGARADRAVERGIDVASTKSAITVAETAIASARTAVTAQTVKTYAFTVTDEATLKANVTASRDAFKKDLEAVQSLVKTAREAVRTAATTLAKTPRIGEVGEAPVGAPASTSSTSTAQ